MGRVKRSLDAATFGSKSIYPRRLNKPPRVNRASQLRGPQPMEEEPANTVDAQRVDDPPSVRFKWAIKNFSRLNTKKYSQVFNIGGYKWRVLMFPKGNGVDHLSLYLDAANSATLPKGWSVYAKFSLTVVNQDQTEFSVQKHAQHQFSAQESSSGFTEFISLRKLNDPGSGYLRNGTIIVEADVAVHTRVNKVVHFRSLEKPKEDEFCLELSKLHNYDDVVERVAQHLGLDDPSKIRLTSHNCYSQQPKSQPIKYQGADYLLDMLVYCNQTSDILYYEVLDVPLPELQGLKTLKVAFHHATEDKVVHTIRLSKQSTVGDVISDLKTKVKLSHPNAEVRLLEIFRHKIYKIFALGDMIKNVNDQYWTLRAEEIPEEEKKIGPHDLLIHVYHFMDTAQNQDRTGKVGPRNLVTPATVKLTNCTPDESESSKSDSSSESESDTSSNTSSNTSPGTSSDTSSGTSSGTSSDTSSKGPFPEDSDEVQNFGEPFFLVIHEGETLAKVKVRLQKKLQVPDEEFSKWKVAFVSLGQPEYLQDTDIVYKRFLERDLYGAWEQYLGLDHSDNPPKRSHSANQVHELAMGNGTHVIEASADIKDHNTELSLGHEAVADEDIMNSKVEPVSFERKGIACIRTSSGLKIVNVNDVPPSLEDPESWRGFPVGKGHASLLHNAEVEHPDFFNDVKYSSARRVIQSLNLFASNLANIASDKHGNLSRDDLRVMRDELSDLQHDGFRINWAIESVDCVFTLCFQLPLQQEITQLSAESTRLRGEIESLQQKTGSLKEKIEHAEKELAVAEKEMGEAELRLNEITSELETRSRLLAEYGVQKYSALST